MNLIKYWRMLIWPLHYNRYVQISKEHSVSYPILIDLELNKEKYRKIFLEEGHRGCVDYMTKKIEEFYEALIKKNTCNHENLREYNMDQYHTLEKDPNVYFCGVCNNCSTEIIYDKVLEKAFNYESSKESER